MKPDVWHDPLFLAELAANGKGGTASGSIVTFLGHGDPLRSLRLDIDPVQAGTGAPSPDNVRPISGWSEVNVYREAAYAPDANPYILITIPTPPGTVYGGYIQGGADGSAELVVDRALKTFTGQEQGWEKFSNNNPNGTYFGLAGTTAYAAFANDPEAICSINKRSGSTALLTGDGFYWTSGGWRILYGAAGGTESLDNFKTYMQQKYAAGTPVAVCAKLASPITYNLSTITVQTLDGQNVMWGDSGGISVEWGNGGRISKSIMLAAIMNDRR